MTVPEHKLQRSDIVGKRYRILSILGKGGMGTVYLAEDLRLIGKKWAIKETVNHTRDYQKFIDEAEMLIKLNHANLPTIVDYFPPSADGYGYLVMDYIKGSTLQEAFEGRRKKLSPLQVVRYARQLCELFHYLHEEQPAPIIYRDLKPSNVMIDEHDRVRLIDFGIARNFKSGRDTDTVRLGTIGFAAPEQFAAKQTDHRTDLYALGALMYFLLSEGNYYYVIQKPLHEARQELPRALCSIVQRLLRTNPEERYQSAYEIKKDLEDFIRAESVISSEAEGRQSKVEIKLMSRKVIVIGGLYPGAGATFMLITLAKLLSYLEIPHAAVEFPVAEPELFSLLYGEKYAPESYRFLTDDILSGGRPEPKRKEWVDGYTTWVPCNPLGLMREWTQEHTYKLLYTLKNPMVLLDVSHHWDHALTQELILSVDEVISMIDTSPAKFQRRDAQRNYRFLSGLSSMERSVQLIANRDVTRQSKEREEWLQSLPMRPLCIVPEIPYEQVIQGIWKALPVQNEPHVRKQLLQALYPLLSRFIPQPYLQQALQKVKKPGLMSRWKRRKSNSW